MDTQNLLNLLLAVVLSTSMHAFAEPMNLMNKVKRLNDKLDKTETARKPGPINTPVKAFFVSLTMIVVFAGIGYFIIGLFDPDFETVAWISIGVLVVIELVNTLRVDKLHEELAKVIDKIN